MAKQSGIHQLRGKIGEHSYYRQSGVASGLVRSINQGLSARVKTSEAYANTRLNNAEFGQACKIAARTLSQIVPKFRPMFLTFSQSKLAKAVLELIKDDSTGAWGQRNIKTASAFESILESAGTLAKVNFDDHYSVSFTEETTNLSVEASLLDASYLASIGADSVDIRLISVYEGIGAFVASAGKYSESLARTFARDTIGLDASNISDNTDIARARDMGAGNTSYASGVLIAVAMPCVTDAGNVRHVLQQYCTFKMYSYTLRQ